MKALISGSNGFIGSHLCLELSSRQYNVVRIPRELLYSPPELWEFFYTEKPDFIFHLAAYGNMSDQKDTSMTVFANFIATYNMLDASKDIPYKKFYNFSTSSVLLERETFYSASKAGAERIANAFAQQLGKPILTVRPFSIYGEGEAHFRFIPTVIRSLLRDEFMPLDLGAHHDWVYVKDFVNTLLGLEKVGVVNMGTGTSYSNIEIVHMLEEISVKKLKYVTDTLRDFDTKKWVSPDKTVKSDIKQGLKKTFEWYKKFYE